MIVRVRGQVDAVPLDQIYRYMGLPANTEDPATAAQVQALMPTFLSQADCQACYLEVPVTIAGDSVDLGVLQTNSRHLARNLRGCDRAVLFAATLGLGVERQKRIAAVRSSVDALVLDAVGSAGIEVWCNDLCAQIAEKYPDYIPRPRFSPGYGDLPLELQRTLLRVLDTGRNIGVTLTDGLLMMPQKSVTAIMGLGASGCSRPGTDCEVCGKDDCEFKR